jgi:hypothetical protein
VGTAAKNGKRLAPRKTAAMPYIKKGLDLGAANGVPCFTEAIPFCLMKGYENRVAERMIPDGPVVDANRFIKDYGVYRRTEGKARGPRCPGCSYFDICEGPWREYPDLYGWNEFKPLKGKKRRV